MRNLPVAPTCRMRTRLPRRANHEHFFAHPAALQRGVSRSSRTLANGMRWTRRVRRSSRSRTEKSCGSGAPTLALSSQRRNRASCGRRGQESPVPGKSTKDTVKTVAQGRPVVRLVPVVTPPPFCLQADHGCGQHPAFPAPSRLRGRSLQQLGRKTRREKAGVWLFDIWIDVASVLGSRRVGWAKRSVPTIHDERAERRWARRKRAFAHPTKSRPGMTGE
jgi:hypothetical protein